MFARSLQWKRSCVAALAAVALAACTSNTRLEREARLVPDDPGLYAVVGGEELMRLDGDREWENETWQRRSSLRSHTNFVLRDPRIATIQGPLNESIRLTRVAWVRSRISDTGDIMPNTGSRWNVPQGGLFDVPVDLRHLAARQDTVIAIPGQPLADGLYSLRLNTRDGHRYARIGVNWPSVDHDRYAARNCVDEYLDTTGQGAEFHPCENQQQLIVAKGLQLHLVKPRVEATGDGKRLVVQGIVVNTTDRERTIPPLMAKVIGTDNTVIREWTFHAAPAALQAGDSTSFETVLEDPPDGTKTVNVRFSQTLTSSN